MRILVEEYQYERSAVEEILRGSAPSESGKVSVPYVGYFFNPEINDLVFILPKVVLGVGGGSGELVFGKYRPEDIVRPDKAAALTPDERRFLYEFPVWVYRAIRVYRNDGRCDAAIVKSSHRAEADHRRRGSDSSYLDIILALLQFNRENRNFLFFTLRNIHSGYNRINWTKTIARTDAIIRDGTPVYLNPVNRKRQADFDEELIIIFYSILNYIGEKYGFPRETEIRLNLIRDRKFEAYLNGLGKTKLLRIKYRYFSDKALKLWRLCYGFFDRASDLSTGTSRSDYLTVKDFYIVFEAIVDELVGDRSLPDGMDKRQEDGKIIDHLFTWPSLFAENRDMYYIGDSKYYKIGHDISHESVYKQYTYARNVIQWNIDIFNEGGRPDSDIVLRDDLTEGYNVIPNFFVSAQRLTDRFDYSDGSIRRSALGRNRHRQIQFKNRLFDRNTLLVYHYDVNFLFVLRLYAKAGVSEKAEWKARARRFFREDIRSWLNEDYAFYAVEARPGVDLREYIDAHFRELIGKICAAYDDNDIISLALDRDPEFMQENERLLSTLRGSLYVAECPLGEDFRGAIDREKADKALKVRHTEGQEGDYLPGGRVIEFGKVEAEPYGNPGPLLHQAAGGVIVGSSPDDGGGSDADPKTGA